MFDLEKALSLEGDSGPYLQYTHTRALSVLAKARAEGISESYTPPEKDILDIERRLYQFPEVVERAYHEHAPQHVAVYLTELSASFNAYYAHTKIADPKDPQAPFRVALTRAVAQTLENGLHVLGMRCPGRM
jgi:arginyl-tRNA synthetase